MCGICGQLMLDARRRAEPARINAMLGRLVHRGPDDAGTYARGPVALGMRRLQVIDVAGGHQPMLSDDEQVVLVYNGEIYNYVELRDGLRAAGVTFRTASDTEVILRLYERKGERCVDDLNGMFAFAIWDGRRGRLLLARDRIGIKPLFYCRTPDALLFASELNALMTNPDVPREPDYEALEDYFTFFYVPGARSAYRHVHKLPPAHTLIVEDGKARIDRYWQLRYRRPARPKPIAHYAEAYRHHLQRAARLQLRSDVPLGVFLSGGLDSTSLLAAVTRATGRTPQTFTIGFDDASYDESAYAREVADRYGCEHHEYRMAAGDLRACAELLPHFGEPYGPFTIVQQYLLSKYSREHITVALGGDGGDELFGGYQTYIASRLARHYLRLPAGLRRGVLRRLARALPVSEKLMSLDFKLREFVRGAEMFEQGRNMAWKVIFDEGERADLLAGPLGEQVGRRDPFRHVRDLEALVGGASDLQKAMYVDLSMFLPDCVLTATDRMTMATSQEVRVPILDHELVEFAATVPDEYKCTRSRTKILVREAMKDWLPASVLRKPKTGFTTPVPIWIRNELRDFVTDVLSPAAVRDTGLLNPAAVERLLADHLAGRADHARRIWALVHFVLWWQKCYHGLHVPRPAGT